MKSIFVFIVLASVLVSAARGGVYSLPTTNTFLQTAGGIGTRLGLNTNNITICLWLSRDADANANGGIISFGKTFDPNSRMHFNLGQFATDGLEFFYYGSPGSGVTASQWRTASGVYTNVNQFDFFAVSYTYTDSNSIRLYINGQSHSGSWISNPSNNPPGDNNDCSVYIGQGRPDGAENTCNTGLHWSGYFSELAIWGAALTSTEIERVRTSKVKGMARQIRTSSLIVYFACDELAIGLVPDTSSRLIDRSWFDGRFALWCNTSSNTIPLGMGERVCSYPPNE